MPELDEVTQDLDPKEERKKLKEENKRLKAEHKAQKKEAKRRAKELEEQVEEAESADEHTAPVFLVTFFIVLIWVAILCILIKLDVGSFGTNVLKPVLQDVPVLNKILPSDGRDTQVEETEDEYYGYKSLREAVEQIKVLELELEKAQSVQASDSDEVEQLRAEVERLRTFENNQVEFQRIKTEFDEEVVYSEKGPGLEAYQKYYESIDPTNAEYLYKQVVQQVQEDAKVTEYAQTYSEMKPKEAAGIFEAMEDNLDLAARILNAMEPSDRGKILGAMKADVAAKLTKIMDPGY